MFWIFGVVLFLLAAGLLIAASHQKKRLALMASMETSTAAELRSMAQSVAGEIGAGSFNQMVEMKGVIRCEQPLQSELTRAPCVHYQMKVTREYEETHWETDANNHRVRRDRRGSETVAENTRSCTFEVEDSTGRVSVDPTGAKIISEKVCDRFERGEPQGGSLSLGGWNLNLGGIIIGDGGRRTIGYRYAEHVVPVGKPIFVLGEATDAPGQLVIRKPGKSVKGGAFIVSTRSEEQLTQSAGKAARWLLVGTVVSAVAGTVLVVLGFFRWWGGGGSAAGDQASGVSRGKASMTNTSPSAWAWRR